MSKVSSFELEGKQAYQHKKYSKAAKLFGQAQLEYQDLNELVKSAEMANNQSVALLQTGKNKKALAALSGTEEIFEQHAEKLQLALAIGNKAAALDALKRTDEAEEEYERCIKYLKDLGEEQYISEVMKSLSILRLKDKRHFEAVVSLNSSLELEEKPTLRQRFVKNILEKFLNKLAK